MQNTKEAVAQVRDIVVHIKPYDDIEAEHIADALSWIDSGAPLFRVVKPDVPPKHLVSYCVLFDPTAEKILLVGHKKALLWLSPGGHVDLNEDPKEAARRECFEELGIEPEFLFEQPIFLTQTLTVGLTAGHTDVTFWYVIKGDSTASYAFDPDEFNDIRWFGLDEIPYEKSDVHQARFIEKLKKML